MNEIRVWIFQNQFYTHWSCEKAAKVSDFVSKIGSIVLQNINVGPFGWRKSLITVGTRPVPVKGYGDVGARLSLLWPNSVIRERERPMAKYSRSKKC